MTKIMSLNAVGIHNNQRSFSKQPRIVSISQETMNSKASTYLGMQLLTGSFRSTGKSIALGCRRPLYTLSGVSPCLHLDCRPKTPPLQRQVNSLYRPRYNVTFSTSPPACATTVVLNPQRDEEGRLLQIDISSRAAKVGWSFSVRL